MLDNNSGFMWLAALWKKSLSKQAFNNSLVFAKNYSSYAVKNSPSVYLFKIWSLYCFFFSVKVIYYRIGKNPRSFQLEHAISLLII